MKSNMCALTLLAPYTFDTSSWRMRQIQQYLEKVKTTLHRLANSAGMTAIALFSVFLLSNEGASGMKGDTPLRPGDLLVRRTGRLPLFVLLSPKESPALSRIILHLSNSSRLIDMRYHHVRSY